MTTQIRKDHVLIPLTRAEAQRVLTDLSDLARTAPPDPKVTGPRLRAARQIALALRQPPGSRPRRGP